MHPPVLSCIGILTSEAIGQRILLQEIVGSQEGRGQMTYGLQSGHPEDNRSYPCQIIIFHSKQCLVKGSKWNCSEATCQKCIADDSGPSLNSLIASCNGAEGRSQLIRVVGLLRDKEPSPSSFQHILPAGKQISNVESSGRLLLHTNVELGMTMQFNPSHKVKTGSYLCRH